MNDKIVVAGKGVPVNYEDARGKTIIPGSVEREIVLGFVGRALATPVTAVTLVVGGAWYDIRVTYEKVIGDIDVEVNRIKSETEVRKMSDVFYTFGSEIKSISNSNYPEEIKRMYANELKKKMKKRFDSLRS
jgi:hypothetical protein